MIRLVVLAAWSALAGVGAVAVLAEGVYRAVAWLAQLDDEWPL